MLIMYYQSVIAEMQWGQSAILDNHDRKRAIIMMVKAISSL